MGNGLACAIFVIPHSREGLFSFTLFFTYFIFGPPGKAAISTCLTEEWRWSQTRVDMGATYIDYQNSIESINEFRARLVDPDITIWRQAGTGEWFELSHVAAVRRNSSFGTAFEAHREPSGVKEGPEFPHVCLKPPCGFKGGRGTSYNPSWAQRVIIHLTKIAIADRTTDRSKLVLTAVEKPEGVNDTPSSASVGSPPTPGLVGGADSGGKLRFPLHRLWRAMLRRTLTLPRILPPRSW